MIAKAFENVLLVEARSRRGESAADLPARRLTSAGEVTEAMASGRGPKYWIARDVSALLRSLADGAAEEAPAPRGEHFVVVLASLDAARQAVLDAVFRRVLVQDRDAGFLPLEELAEVFASPNREELLIGGVVDLQDEVVVLYRGNMEPLLVPTAWFEPSGDGVRPDFGDFAVADFGQTVRFGDYEATAEAILYEFDAEYRRRARRRLREADRTFGGSLRRLRLQKGVRRDDFPGLSEKQVARIERGEISKPRASTIAALAKRLGVRPEEIEEY